MVEKWSMRVALSSSLIATAARVNGGDGCARNLDRVKSDLRQRRRLGDNIRSACAVRIRRDGRRGCDHPPRRLLRPPHQALHRLLRPPHQASRLVRPARKAAAACDTAVVRSRLCDFVGAGSRAGLAHRHALVSHARPGPGAPCQPEWPRGRRPTRNWRSGEQHSIVSARMCTRLASSDVSSTSALPRSADVTMAVMSLVLSSVSKKRGDEACTTRPVTH